MEGALDQDAAPLALEVPPGKAELAAQRFGVAELFA